MSEYKYIYQGMVGNRDSRHEAVGDLAKHGGWDSGEVVAITENCLVRWSENGPVHLGDKHYDDRDMLATTHGAVRIESESLVRYRNGNRQDVVESYWEIKCPVCYETHKSDEATEDARADLIDEVLDCCGIEWFPPSDWVEDCDICGESHRGKFECTPPAYRDPFPGVDNDYGCAKCGWDGDGEELQGPDGGCPNCDSTAVKVKA